MRLRLNSRNGHKPARLKPEPKPSPMNWRPQSADDLIGQAGSICAAQAAKARSQWLNLRAIRDIAEPINTLATFGKPLPL